jgi:hypothetical protein
MKEIEVFQLVPSGETRPYLADRRGLNHAEGDWTWL